MCSSPSCRSPSSPWCCCRETSRTAPSWRLLWGLPSEPPVLLPKPNWKGNKETVTAGPVCDLVTRVSDGREGGGCCFPRCPCSPLGGSACAPCAECGDTGSRNGRPQTGSELRDTACGLCLPQRTCSPAPAGRGRRALQGTTVPFPWDQLLQNKGNTFAIKALTTLVQKRVLLRSQRPRGTATSRESQRTMDSCFEGMRKHPDHHEKREREETRRKPPPSHI